MRGVKSLLESPTSLSLNIRLSPQIGEDMGTNQRSLPFALRVEPRDKDVSGGQCRHKDGTG
jgi:hypothetical protein